MVGIAKLKYITLFTGLLALALAGCSEQHLPLTAAHAQPDPHVIWAEMSVEAVADGNVHIYY